jgi:BolA protein
MMLQKIEIALAALQPQALQVEDESYMHSRGKETHFKVVLVTDAFEGARKLQRHQKVYATLGTLMEEIYALTLHTYTPSEWQAEQAVPDSPKCMGGSLHDKQ